MNLLHIIFHLLIILTCVDATFEPGMFLINTTSLPITYYQSEVCISPNNYIPSIAVAKLDTPTRQCYACISSNLPTNTVNLLSSHLNLTALNFTKNNCDDLSNVPTIWCNSECVKVVSDTQCMLVLEWWEYTCMLMLQHMCATAIVASHTPLETAQLF
jgi:hypothetical protein